MTRRPVHRFGDRALLVDCADLAEVLALTAALEGAPLAGQVDLQAAERSLVVLLAGTRQAVAAADRLARMDVPPAAPDPATGRTVVLETVYDGPDLDDVAALRGLSREAVVAQHTGEPWTGAFAGFAPGFVYLVREGWAPVPRRPEPRPSVPAGSVAVGGPYGAVYPRSTPGGWQLLGRTGAVLWDPAARSPAGVRAGDVVTFRAVREVVVARPRPRSPEAPGGPTLTVLDPGPLTLVQDRGRPGHRAVGVAVSGAADRRAARAALRAVGCRPGAALLETVGGGLELRADADVVVVLTGAATRLELLGPEPVGHAAGRPVAVRAGQTLRVPEPASGLRSYLAVRGGFLAPAVLGSRATDVLAGLGPAAVVAGQVLAVGVEVDASVEVPDVAGAPEGPEPPEPATGPVDVVVRVTGAPRHPGAATALARGTWTVAEPATRVALRLAGDPLALPDAGRTGTAPSEGLVPGAIQVPPSGRPVVFLVDHPATGGYPVVAVVQDADLDRLAQARPGDGLRFRLVEPQTVPGP